MPALDAPASHAIAVTPSDSEDLPTPSRAINIGHGGDLKVTMIDEVSVVTFSNLSAGWHPIRVRRVWNTGTTATSIVSVW